MPNISVYVRRYLDEQPLFVEPVTEIRVEAGHDATPEMIAAAATAAASVAASRSPIKKSRLFVSGARLPCLPEDGGGIARVIRDADVQYVIDALIHAGAALSSLHRLTAIEWPNDPHEERFEIDNSRVRALVDSALGRLGVNPLSDLPLRDIRPDSASPPSTDSTRTSEATR
ncbi:hypothetical protein B0G62_10485 [Paraburkholderia eburnea]|uniref:Uncharacterized protein n=1 Tax=Paraburkholderia eburnea TaxID=1189126 RepID=A0A2S4MDF3_9BURK|nr:hypothetical protein [Paraburkholderia eburnea]POR52788.1 hypothetical protein B0G62_10485 [Paraburkholderia eburnea]PRZ23656.1 hypothetical protein BX588_10485 [Paraburkholderia eburnea]